jgi:cell division protein FtsN
MRRIDAIAIMVAFFGFGGIAFWVFRTSGFDEINAGVWSQVVLVGVLIAWISTYVFRAVTQTMTYNQQLDEYKKAVLTKQLEEMSPAERERLLAEVAAEKQGLPTMSEDIVKNAVKDE